MLYLEYVAQHIGSSDAIVLFPDANEPVEERFYQEDLASCTENIADLEERLNTADDENRKELEEELANMKSRREHIEATRWAISADKIADYRGCAPQ